MSREYALKLDRKVRSGKLTEAEALRKYRKREVAKQAERSKRRALRDVLKRIDGPAPKVIKSAKKKVGKPAVLPSVPSVDFAGASEYAILHDAVTRPLLPVAGGLSAVEKAAQVGDVARRLFEARSRTAGWLMDSGVDSPDPSVREAFSRSMNGDAPVRRELMSGFRVEDGSPGTGVRPAALFLPRV